MSKWQFKETLKRTEKVSKRRSMARAWSCTRARRHARAWVFIVSLNTPNYGIVSDKHSALGSLEVRFNTALLFTSSTKHSPVL